MAVAADPDGLARAVRASGLSALTLARRDLAASRETLVRVARSLRAAGVPYVLSNLACEPRASEVCEAIVDASDPALMVTVAGQRIAVISAVHPSALTHVAHDRSDGNLAAEPSASAHARRAGRAQQRSATGDRRVRPAQRGLARRRARGRVNIPADDAPDVLLVNGILVLQRALAGDHGRMHIVATRAAGVTRVDALD